MSVNSHAELIETCSIKFNLTPQDVFIKLAEPGPRSQVLETQQQFDDLVKSAMPSKEHVILVASK